MKNYPPKNIRTTDGIVNILQLTDLHLCKDKKATTNGINVHDSFIACLLQALAEDIRCDLMILTGDLINELDPSIYERIFDTLDATHIPYICLSGNHDVTEEATPNDSRSSQPSFISTAPDARLVSQCRIGAEDWQILCLDSSSPGHVDGVLTADTLAWLSSTLASYPNTPTLIALHHHAIPVHSLWLDDYILSDYKAFWQTIKPYSQVKALVNGHVHQEFYGYKYGVACFMTPSTCYQFKPNQAEFTYDDTAKPGYRWLKLADDATIKSWVVRLNS